MAAEAAAGVAAEVVEAAAPLVVVEAEALEAVAGEGAPAAAAHHQARRGAEAGGYRWVAEPAVPQSLQRAVLARLSSQPPMSIQLVSAGPHLARRASACESSLITILSTSLEKSYTIMMSL